MADVDTYRQLVQALLKNYAQVRPATETAETELVMDTERDHYQLVNVGWDDERRIYGCTLHIDIKGDKVWIQHNGTEHHVAEDLAERGIPKEHIVLGFHSPYKRQFTDYAVN
jgi:hypothetical protein